MLRKTNFEEVVSGETSAALLWIGRKQISSA